jgi:putative ABC transport system permease protein
VRRSASRSHVRRSTSRSGAAAWKSASSTERGAFDLYRSTISVARRTREIGVRVALGAQPLQVLASVFERPLVQVALGIGVGATLGFGLANDDLSAVHLDALGNTAVFALSTTLCCALACIVPTRRALRIQPTEALKDEG